MPYITAAVIAGTAIYGAIDASNRRSKAKDGIDKLKEMQPKFRSGKDIQTEAELTIQQGYSPAEVAAFNQRLVRTNNAGYQQATQRNPNFAPQVQAGINYANVGAQVDFASRDAALRRSRISEFASRVGAQSNAQTQADIQSKREQEIAYGNAKSQANADIYNSLTQLAYAGANYGIASQGTGTGMAGTTQPTGNALGGQAPMMNMQNPAPQYGDNWGRSLYGQSARTQPPQPYFGTTQFGYQQYGRPLMQNQIPSRQANPALFDPYLLNYY